MYRAPRPVRMASSRAQALWRDQLALDDTSEIEIEENDQEWLTNQQATKAAREASRAVTRRALAWLEADAPRKPLGRWAKGKVWSNMAEMYV